MTNGAEIAVKQKKLSASLEDYLEAIYNICREGEVARSKTIASVLSVAKPSVTAALRLLKDRGLVNYKPYGYITLTEKGGKVAEVIVKKHDIIKSFFVEILGVDKETAQTAACRAEHALGPQIIAGLLELTEFLQDGDPRGRDLVSRFEKYRVSRQRSQAEPGPLEGRGEQI